MDSKTLKNLVVAGENDTVELLDVKSAKMG